jgi:hypothetical protein
MKKQQAMALLIAVFMVMVGAQAEETKAKNRGAPILATLNIIQVSDSQLEKLDGVQKTSSAVQGRVLQSLELMTVPDHPSLLMLGEKWPIVYFDHRAEQFQIQYVDIGGKLDLTCRSAGADAWNVEIRPEASAMNEIDLPGDPRDLEVYPKTTVLVAETNIVNLKFGETSVFAKITGRAARSYLEAMGLPAGNPNVLYTLRLERP